MIKLLVFDKDGVLLSLTATWLPVIEAVAAHTISRLPEGKNTITAADLLALIGVDVARGQIDPSGFFAHGSFAAIQSVWQKHLPASMLDLQSDTGYQAEIEALMLKLVRGKSVAKGDIKVPLGNLYAAGFRLALLTNDNEVSAQQNLSDLGVATLFSTVVGADSGHGAKPEPGGLLYCCAANGVDPAQALMIGDTLADYGAAISAGVADFICIADDVDARPDPAIKPENVIPDLTGLPELLLRRKDTLLRRNEG